MKARDIFTKILIQILLLLCMTGCGREGTGVQEVGKQGKAELEQTGEKPEEMEVTREAEEPETDITMESAPAIKEIPVDFPFYEADSYSLTLAQMKEPDGEYELRFYNKDGEILQQIPCGSLAEPIEFSCDVLYGGSVRELEIFPADCDVGLFFEWRWDSGRFSEVPIEIPKYVEKRGHSMLTVEENDMCQIKKIYQLNREKQCVDESRLWELKKDTGELKIWDAFEKQSLFEGIVSLDEEGNPANGEYYDMLFWEDRYFLTDGLKDSTDMSAWIDEPRTESTEESEGLAGFEWAQREVFGNDGHGENYESREDFLTEFGFSDSDPVFQYYGRDHNLQLELYRDEFSDRFCGITYGYSFDNERKKSMGMYGFTINTVQEQVWVEEDPFCTKTVYGDNAADFVSDAEEIIEYTPSGKPDYFRIEGWKEQEADEEIKNALTTVLEINYVYRDDGTLFRKDYWHDSYTFGSTLCSLKSHYDEKGRIVYKKGYITHGSLEYYYFYNGKGKKPAYCLILDHNLGYGIPHLIRFR